MQLYEQSAFPNMFAPKHEKDRKSYGLQVAKAVLGSTSQWRETFIKKLSENRKYAEGKQEIHSYLREMDIDTKEMFTNISFKPRPIAQSFIRSVVQGYNLRQEYPNVNSLSKYIAEKKEQKKQEARFRMKYQDVINQLTQESGVQLEDPDVFVPEDEEDLDLHFQLNDKEIEELLMQEMVTFALEDNNILQLKSDTLYEQFIAQFHGYYDYIDSKGRWKVDFIQAEDIITDNSFREDFNDASYKGRFLRMNVVDVRRKFNLTADDEKKLYNYAMSCTGKYGNSNRRINWLDDYRYSDVRPYDNFTIELAHIWLKTAKVLRIVEGKDRYGRKVFDVDYKISEDSVKSDGRKKIWYKYPLTAYEGYFTADGELCLEWGEQRNILRDGQDKEELLSPFIFFMPENRGRMLPNSLMNMMIDSIRAMDLAILKIKQVIAKAAPDGYIIDVDALQEIDLGNGLLNPLQIKDIKQQTGDLYYRGKREDGSDNQIPIRDSISQFETKIQAFINNYNFELSNIRQYLGVNEFRDGSASSARIGFRFMQAQAQASNTITWFIYQAYLSSAQELMRHAGIRIWDALISDNVNEGYARYLGNKNIEWIKAKKDITSSSYDIKFSMGISEDDKTILQEYINTCLGQGSLQMPDALMINRIKDPMVAEKMLSYLFKKRSKERDRIALEQQTAQAKAQEQMGVAVEQAKQESIKLQITSDYEKAKTKGEQDRDLAMEQYAYKFMEIALTQGIQLPPEYQAIVEGVIQNRGMSVAMETQEKEQVLEQQAIQEEQAMMEQELAAYSEELQRRIGNGEMTEEQAQAEMDSVITGAGDMQYEGMTNISDEEANTMIQP